MIRIFPNDDSALRLIGALLAEQNDNWQECRYINMDEFNDWITENRSQRTGHNVVALAS